MNKKMCIIIGSIIVIAIITIILFIAFLPKNNDASWTKEILNSDNYEITMTDCNSRQKNLSKDLIDTIEKKWNTLSNNGPWTGDSNICYLNVTFSYENHSIINQIQLQIIDDDSLVLTSRNNSTYYVNSKEINDLLKQEFQNS